MSVFGLYKRLSRDGIHKRGRDRLPQRESKRFILKYVDISNVYCRTLYIFIKKSTYPSSSESFLIRSRARMIQHSVRDYHLFTLHSIVRFLSVVQTLFWLQWSTLRLCTSGKQIIQNLLSGMKLITMRCLIHINYIDFP